MVVPTAVWHMVHIIRGIGSIIESHPILRPTGNSSMHSRTEITLLPGRALVDIEPARTSEFVLHRARSALQALETLLKTRPCQLGENVSMYRHNNAPIVYIYYTQQYVHTMK